ncbi:MAG: hypothetical protein AMJ81_08480 [Phycisphaerae bacterium SM23_33]|nr:MAG: hypothetical protein AMJ81_08480 [Phycisphaerae bacterium SM23_33]
MIADPHIHMYNWRDGELAKQLRGWAAAKARFGVVVGDLGTGKSLQPDGDGQTRQQDKFARTIASVKGCPPVLLSMGNHELDGDGKKSWLDALYPGVVKGITGNGNDRFFYYSFNYRGCHFVCLDANRILPGRPPKVDLGMLPEDQLEWLEKDLAANKGKLTFVFLHEPVEQVHYDTPYYLLKNRAGLIGVLKRFPDVQWIFHGHLHYDDHVKAWGLNVIHCGSHIVRVTGQTAQLARITPKGLAPAQKEPYDLGKELAGRASQENGIVVYRIGEDKLEPPGRTCSLKKHVRLVPAEDGVQPTHGKTMMKINKPLAARDRNSFTHLCRYLSTADVIPIVKGMKFSYDVRCANSVYDNLAIQLRITMPKGRQRGRLENQNGMLMENVHAYHSPSLQGKADASWYHREADISALAGGWIDMITLFTTRPNNAPYPAGELNIYVDDIKFTWPAEQ